MTMVYGSSPNFHFLKVFGCACFPFLRPYNHNKLHFRSTKCVFIGCNSKHKGYRSLHSSGRVYLAMDVLFNEEEFPFLTSFPKPTVSSCSQSSQSLVPIPFSFSEFSTFSTSQNNQNGPRCSQSPVLNLNSLSSSLGSFSMSLNPTNAANIPVSNSSSMPSRSTPLVHTTGSVSSRSTYPIHDLASLNPYPQLTNPPDTSNSSSQKRFL